MQAIQLLFSRWPAAGLGLFLAGNALSARAAGETNPTARIVRLTGQARISTDNKSWQTLKAGDNLAPGNLAQTAPKSQLDISLDNPGTGAAPAFETANVVSLLGGSVLHLNRLAARQTNGVRVETVELELLAGQLGGRFRKPPAGSRYEINFPNGILGIRGGSFQLTAAGRLEVSEGSVVVSMTLTNRSLVTREVTAGHQFDPATGLVTTAGPNRTPPPKAGPPEPKPVLPATSDDPLKVVPKRKF